MFLLGPIENFIKKFNLIFLKFSDRAAAANCWKGRELCLDPSQLMAG
jgi:hypothetical protein